MTAALFAEEWKDPNAKEHGRNGQRQHGVDVYGRRNGAWCRGAMQRAAPMAAESVDCRRSKPRGVRSFVSWMSAVGSGPAVVVDARMTTSTSKPAPATSLMKTGGWVCSRCT